MSKPIPSCVAILAALLSTVRAVAECSSVLVVTYEGGKRLELAAKDVASITYESTGDPAYAGPGARIDNTAELLERYAPTMLVRMRSGQTHRMVLQVLHRLPNPRIDFSCIDTPGTGKPAAPPPGGAVATNPGVPSVVSPAPGAPGSAPKPQASSSPAGRWSLDSNTNKGVLEISASGAGWSGRISYGGWEALQRITYNSGTGTLSFYRPSGDQQFTGRLSANRIAGTFTYKGKSYPWSATR